jgi:hypothetical protein
MCNNKISGLLIRFNTEEEEELGGTRMGHIGQGRQTVIDGDSLNSYVCSEFCVIK